MLIKLLAPTHPTVLFSITYQNLPDELSNPLAWTSLLSSLNVDSLEIPLFTHALDRASWMPSILEEVTFNTSLMNVHCTFVDGHAEEWPLSSTSCLDALTSVLNDVTLSSEVADMEREKEREKRIRAKQRELARQQSLNSPPATVKVKGHRKSRSLLMSLVSSLVNLPLSLQDDRSHSLPISCPPSPTLPELEEEPMVWSPPGLSPKALRRRARSTLVDTFRAHVLSELRRRLPDGYYPWILKSMLRRATDAMLDIISQTEEQVHGYTTSPFDDEGGYFPPPALNANPFEPEPELDDGDTDTDGSSVHTPSTSHFNCPNYSLSAKGPSSLPSHLRDLSSDDLYEYNSLSAICVRLRQLLILSEAQKEHIENETRQRNDILEVRSRRRAWQNKSLVASGGNRDVGLATPYTSSRLSQVVWSADDFEYVSPTTDVEEEMIEEYEFDAKLTFGSRRIKGKGDTKLFPVSEEEEGDLFNAEEYELELGLEEGLRSWKIDDEDEDDSEEEKVRPRIRPRARTNSMHEERSPQMRKSALTATSLLCQPLSEKLPMYTEVEVTGLGVAFGGYSRFTGDEFTLSMDLPFKKGLSVSSMDPEPEKHWHAASMV